MIEHIDAPIVLRPRWWYLVSAAVFGAVLVVAARAIFGVRLAGLEIVTIVVPFMLWRTLRATFGPDGVTQMKDTVAWPDVNLRHVWWSGWILNGRTPEGKRVGVAPAMYEARWRTGRVGSMISYYRPDLVAGPPPPAGDPLPSLPGADP